MRPTRTNADSVIGGPLPGLRIHLLDDNLQPVPTGVVGEMYVAGGQLARGYVGRPGLTAGRFVANPFDAAGERLYRSGDTAMWTETGELVYVGRSDHQVKVRGYRIELGEVESALATLPGSRERRRCRPGRRPGARGSSATWSDANRSTSQRCEPNSPTRLPDYMVPSALVVLDALPLTVNGKLDRAALPEPGTVASRRDGRESVAGRRHRRRCWPRCAPRSSVPQSVVDDDFFTMGGDSIVAIQLVNRARRQGCGSPRSRCSSTAPRRHSPRPQARAPRAPPPRTIPAPTSARSCSTPIVQRLAELGGIGRTGSTRPSCCAPRPV